MPFQKRTTRRLPPLTRELAKDISKLETYARRIKNKIRLYADLEREVIAWITRQEHYKNKQSPDPIFPDPRDQTDID